VEFILKSMMLDPHDVAVDFNTVKIIIYRHYLVLNLDPHFLECNCLTIIISLWLFAARLNPIKLHCRYVSFYNRTMVYSVIIEAYHPQCGAR